MNVYYTDTSTVSKGMAKHFINEDHKNACFKSTILMYVTIRKQ